MSGEGPNGVEATNFKIRSGWHAELAPLIVDLERLGEWIAYSTEDSNPQPLLKAINSHLRSARAQISRPFGLGRTSVLASLEAVYVDIIRLAPPSFLYGALPGIVMYVKGALDKDDLRTNRLDVLVNCEDSNAITEDARATIVASLVDANEAARRSRLRLESFRNVIVVVAMFLTAIALSAAIWGWIWPTTLPMCFKTDSAGVLTVVCASNESEAFAAPGIGVAGTAQVATAVAETASARDIVFVQFLGLLGAALASAVAIKDIRGSGDPYSIPLALSVLKLPTGALTALFGIILVRAGLVPGIESLDTRAEIIAWALILGYAQQVFTGAVDRQAATVLKESNTSSIVDLSATAD